MKRVWSFLKRVHRDEKGAEGLAQLDSRIRQEIRVEEARTEQALQAYEQSVLLALEETENAMVGYVYARERSGLLDRAVRAAEKSSGTSRVTIRFASENPMTPTRTVRPSVIVSRTMTPMSQSL